MSRVWGYIGTTKIIELNPEKKEEAFGRAMEIAIDRFLKNAKREECEENKEC